MYDINDIYLNGFRRFIILNEIQDKIFSCRVIEKTHFKN